MLCKDKLANLDFKSKTNNAKDILLHFFLIKKKKNKRKGKKEAKCVLHYFLGF